VTRTKRISKPVTRAVLVGAKLPAHTVQELKETVLRLDTDVSKFLRAAIREKLARSK
jgi:hypothetical protein